MSRRRPAPAPPPLTVGPYSLILTFLVTVLALVYAYRTPDWRPVAAEAQRAIFRMDIDGKGECTAFGIRTGVMLTAAHCDGTALTLDQDGRRVFAVAKDVQHDLLALVLLPKATDGVLFLAPEEPPTGTPVALCGFPFNFPNKYFRVGVVAQPHDGDGQMGLDIHIAPGDSGAPVLDFAGRVVGLAANHYVGNFGDPAYVTFAVPLHDIRAFVEKLR